MTQTQLKEFWYKVPNDQVDVKTIQDMTNLLDELLAKKV